MSDLAMTEAEVASLTRPERTARVVNLIAESNQLLDAGIEQHIHADNKELAGIVVLYSGGNDSTCLAHLFRHKANYAAHANTGVGVEATRQFVRDTCDTWAMPLLERSAPRMDDTYRAMVLAHGFPGPGHHYKMFQRLKERALRVVRAEIINGRSRTHRVVFLAGRRRQESERRANVPEFERDGAIVWVSPMVNWTKLDLNTYRLLSGNVPVNRVSDLIHMSGECLCGSFAHQGERDEISQWFPEAFTEIAELELLIADRPDIADHAKTWGWGWEWPNIRAQHKTGRLCTSCDARHQNA